MLVFATFAALDSVVAYTAPAFVLSSGAFGKAADEATDLEKSLLKLWGGAARRKVAASYRTRPPSRASFHPALYLGRWPRLYTTRRRRPTGLVTALRQREARFNFSRRRLRVVGCSHRQPRLRKERTRVSCLSLALQTAVQFESLFNSKGTMASDLKPWYVKMVLSSSSITCDFGMVPLTLMALISLGKL